MTCSELSVLAMSGGKVSGGGRVQHGEKEGEGSEDEHTAGVHRGRSTAGKECGCRRAVEKVPATQ